MTEVPAFFTHEDAERLLQELGEIEKKRSEERPLPEGFASVFSETTGITERNFVSRISGPTEIERSSAMTIKKGRNPTPEEFGQIIEKIELTQEQVDDLTQTWLDEFRKSITLGDVGREYGVSRELVRQISTKLGFKGNQNWDWEAAEAVRAYREEKIKETTNSAGSTKPVAHLQRGRKKLPLEEVITKFESGRPISTRKLSNILQNYQPTDEQVERLIGVWLPRLRNTISCFTLGREYGVTHGTINAQAKRMGLINHDGRLNWDGVESIRRDRDSKIESAKTTKKKPSVPNKTTIAKRTRSKGMANSAPRVAVVPSESVDPENRPEYPNVLTSDYLSSLIEVERSGVSKLRGSSFLYPVNLDEQYRIAVEYLIKERIFPQHASIRRRKGEDGADSYYLDYHLSPIR